MAFASAFTTRAAARSVMVFFALFCLSACHTPMKQTPPAVADAAPAYQQEKVPQPPVAAKKPHQVPSPNGSRIDEYYWLRDDKRQDAEMLA